MTRFKKRSGVVAKDLRKHNLTGARVAQIAEAYLAS